MAKVAPDESSRIVINEMAADWLRLAEAAPPLSPKLDCSHRTIFTFGTARRSAACMTMDKRYDVPDTRYAMALGQAVVQSWAELPQEIQQLLFERAVVAGHHAERDESMREQLATFLHDNNPRTAGAI